MNDIEMPPKFSISKEDIQQLMHVFSHDLRNPLVNMEALIREMRMCYEDQNENIAKQDDMQDNLIMMDEVLARMNDLIYGINEVYHAMFDDLLSESIDVFSLLERELKRYQKKYGIAKHVTVSIQVSGRIWADPLWAGKMIAVLIENAFQAMGEEGCLSIEMNKRNGLDVLVIRDSGIGMGKSDLNYIFQPFFSLTGRKGMGLALLRAWAQAHGGKVWCESRQDMGSIFYIGFPQYKQKEV